MGTLKDSAIPVCHVVALPYPGRGHINPMMNLCKSLASKKPDNILITFVVTEEWHGFIGSDPKPENIRFATLPNVIPSELVRANDLAGFVEAVNTKLEAPFEQLLDGLEPQSMSVIVADPYVAWAVRVGNRRNIPVASFWPMSASVLSFLLHSELLKQNGHFPLDVSERGDEIIDYIPGIGATCIADLPNIFSAENQTTIETVTGVAVHKAQYLLSTSVYELEPQAFDTLKAKFAFPVYPIGPSIPHFELSKTTLPTSHNYVDLNYWLDSQPKQSVLYISLGSFLSISKAQMDEISAGVKSSEVRFLWVARGEASRVRDGVGDKGLVVPWCDQLRVLCHDSIGGFWSHCGWNSTLEAVYAGLPILTRPIIWDQMPNSKQIVEDWKIGYRVNKKAAGAEHLVTREEIAELVQRFMDLESMEGKEIRERAKQLQQICQGAIAKGGSSDKNLDAFIGDISQGHLH